MSGLDLQVTISDARVMGLLQNIQVKLGNLRPAMNIIGQVVRTSVVENFMQSGRPTHWAPLSPMTLARRKGTTILRRQGFAGGLLGSIHVEAGDDEVRIGTDKVYGAIHHYGAKKGQFGTVLAKIKAHIRKLKSGKEVQVREHSRSMSIPWGDIPARPFMLVQPEDWDQIRKDLAEFILGGKV